MISTHDTHHQKFTHWLGPPDHSSASGPRSGVSPRRYSARLSTIPSSIVIPLPPVRAAGQTTASTPEHRPGCSQPRSRAYAGSVGISAARFHTPSRRPCGRGDRPAPGPIAEVFIKPLFATRRFRSPGGLSSRVERVEERRDALGFSRSREAIREKSERSRRPAGSVGLFYAPIGDGRAAR